MTIEKTARKIMMKMKGYRPKDMKDDFEDHPEAHTHELNWLVRELKKVRKKGREDIAK